MVCPVDEKNMTRVEQHKIVLDLAQVSGTMNTHDGSEFAMFQKRDKDDEDLDFVSQQRLDELHKKYVTRRKPKDIDGLLRKYAQQVKDFGPGKV